PKMLSTYLHYVRNLCLIERRMTPDLYSLVLAAKQIAGDQFAITLAEMAREYDPIPAPGDGSSKPVEHHDSHSQNDRFEKPVDAQLRMTAGAAQLPDGDVVRMKCRLPGQAISWRTLELKPKAPMIDQAKWRMRWNP